MEQNSLTAEGAKAAKEYFSKNKGAKTTPSEGMDALLEI